jgi:hypothetical protein
MAEHNDKQRTVKEQVWLCQKLHKGQFTHGLARLKNGMIVVAEIYNYPSGFSEAGHCEYVGAQRLYPGTKKLIIRSLYRACYEWLEKNGGVPERGK